MTNRTWLVSKLVMNGKVTINVGRVMLGLPRIDAGNVRLNPPLPANLSAAITEIERRKFRTSS
jgi:hypothetical protein